MMTVTCSVDVCTQTYASEFNRFRMEEVPRHLKDKYHLSTLYDELKVRVNGHQLMCVVRFRCL